MAPETQRWRIALVSILLVLIAGNLYAVFAPPDGAVGNTGFLAVATQDAFVAVAHVQPGSAAYRAGLRDGDRLDYRALSFDARVSVKMDARDGQVLDFPVSRGGRRIDIRFVVPPQQDPWSPIGILGILSTLFVTVCAAVVCWRGAATIQGRLLAGLLLTTVWPFSNSIFATSSAVANALAQFGGDLVGYMVAPLLAYGYFRRFGVSSPARRAAGASLIAVSVTFYGILFARYLGIATLWFDVSPFAFERNAVIAGLTILQAAVILAYIVLSWLESAPLERPRMAWIAWAVAIPQAWQMADIVLLYANAGNTSAIIAIGTLVELLSAAFIVYGVANRRVLDIGFALNRAAVFTGVSVVILGLFVLVEWAATEWLREASRAANVAVGGVIALSLGLGSRFIHARVDRFVDRVFFRKRHDDESALRTFAHRALYIADPAVLLERTRAVLLEHAGATRVDIYFCADETIPVDDPALVALRAAEPRAALDSLDTALSGDTAYPLAARAHLIGVVTITSEDAGRSYAPDEVAAIEAVTHNVGLALDALRLQTGESEFAALVADLRAMIGALDQRMRMLEQPG